MDRVSELFNPRSSAVPYECDTLDHRRKEHLTRKQRNDFHRKYLVYSSVHVMSNGSMISSPPSLPTRIYSTEYSSA